LDSSCIYRNNDSEIIKLKQHIDKVNKKCEAVEKEKEAFQFKYENQRALTQQYKNKMLNLERNFKTAKETIKSYNESMHNSFIVEEPQNLTQTENRQSKIRSSLIGCNENKNFIFQGTNAELNKRATLIFPLSDYTDINQCKRTFSRPISSIGKTTVNSTSIIKK